jgi:signal transduction histidine kinase
VTRSARKGLSLKYRIALMIFLLEAVMMGFVLWQTLGASLQSSREQLTANEQAMLGLVGGVGRIALLTEDYADMQPYLEEVLDDPRVSRALLADVDGRVVASTRPGDVGMTLQSVLDQPADGDLFWRTREIRSAAGLLGELGIEFSNDALVEAFTRARNLGVSIAAIGMGIIAVAGLATGFMLTRRLESLADAAGHIARGEPTPPLAMRSGNELAQLGQAFDTMAEELAAERRRTAEANEALERRVEERTAELAQLTRELEAFSYSVSHDLRAPLRSMNGFSQILLDDYGEKLDGEGRRYLERIRYNAVHMAELIDDLLQLSMVSRSELMHERVDLSAAAEEILTRLQRESPDRRTEVSVEAGLQAEGDARLLGIALENLLGNAWKYTGKTDPSRIEFGAEHDASGTIYFVRDNGVGFDAKHAAKLFEPFQRLHSAQEFAGTGIGLATVQRIIRRHDGRVWAEAEPGRGAIFRFTLG